MSNLDSGTEHRSLLKCLACKTLFTDTSNIQEAKCTTREELVSTHSFGFFLSLKKHIDSFMVMNRRTEVSLYL